MFTCVPSPRRPQQPFVIQINFITFASRCQRACKYRLLNLKYFVFEFKLVLFLLFSYKTTCTWSNQFCSVQTTKIPVLHYQILHIQNIYKAQVENYSFLLPLTRRSTLLWLSKLCELALGGNLRLIRKETNQRQQLIYQQWSSFTFCHRWRPVLEWPNLLSWGFATSSNLCFPSSGINSRLPWWWEGSYKGKTGQIASSENLCCNYGCGWGKKNENMITQHLRISFRAAATQGTQCSLIKANKAFY